MKNKQVRFTDWGLIDYKEAWDKQEELFSATVNQKIRITNHKIVAEGNEYDEDEITLTTWFLRASACVYLLAKAANRNICCWMMAGP